MDLADYVKGVLAADRGVSLRTAAYVLGLERISAAINATGSTEAYRRGR